MTENQKLREALQSLIDIIDAAGLLNLSNGVLYGPTVWYVKASDIMIAAREAIAFPDVPETNFWKLREELQVARDHIDMDALEISHCKEAELIREALALPTADHIPDSGEKVADQAPNAGKMIETAAPVGERELFERTMIDKFDWERKDFKTDARDFYIDGHTVTAFVGWRARAALSAGDAVDGLRLDFIEKSARCDPKMDGQHVWWPTSLNKALKGPTLRDAIDAAMRKGQL